MSVSVIASDSWPHCFQSCGSSKKFHHGNLRGVQSFKMASSIAKLLNNTSTEQRQRQTDRTCACMRVRARVFFSDRHTKTVERERSNMDTDRENGKDKRQTTDLRTVQKDGQQPSSSNMEARKRLQGGEQEQKTKTGRRRSGAHRCLSRMDSNLAVFAPLTLHLSSQQSTSCGEIAVRVGSLHEHRKFTVNKLHDGNSHCTEPSASVGHTGLSNLKNCMESQDSA